MRLNNLKKKFFVENTLLSNNLLRHYLKMIRNDVFIDFLLDFFYPKTQFTNKIFGSHINMNKLMNEPDLWMQYVHMWRKTQEEVYLDYLFTTSKYNLTNVNFYNPYLKNFNNISKKKILFKEYNNAKLEYSLEYQQKLNLQLLNIFDKYTAIFEKQQLSRKTIKGIFFTFLQENFYPWYVAVILTINTWFFFFFQLLYLISIIITIPSFCSLYFYFFFTDSLSNFDFETAWVQFSFFHFYQEYLLHFFTFEIDSVYYIYFDKLCWLSIYYFCFFTLCFEMDQEIFSLSLSIDPDYFEEEEEDEMYTEDLYEMSFERLFEISLNMLDFDFYNNDQNNYKIQVDNFDDFHELEQSTNDLYMICQNFLFFFFLYVIFFQQNQNDFDFVELTEISDIAFIEKPEMAGLRASDPNDDGDTDATPIPEFAIEPFFNYIYESDTSFGLYDYSFDSILLKDSYFIPQTFESRNSSLLYEHFQLNLTNQYYIFENNFTYFFEKISSEDIVLIILSLFLLLFTFCLININYITYCLIERYFLGKTYINKILNFGVEHSILNTLTQNDYAQMKTFSNVLPLTASGQDEGSSLTETELNTNIINGFPLFEDTLLKKRVFRQVINPIIYDYDFFEKFLVRYNYSFIRNDDHFLNNFLEEVEVSKPQDEIEEDYFYNTFFEDYFLLLNNFELAHWFEPVLRSKLKKNIAQEKLDDLLSGNVEEDDEGFNPDYFTREKEDEEEDDLLLLNLLTRNFSTLNNNTIKAYSEMPNSIYYFLKNFYNDSYSSQAPEIHKIKLLIEALNFSKESLLNLRNNFQNNQKFSRIFSDIYQENNKIFETFFLFDNLAQDAYDFSDFQKYYYLDNKKKKKKDIKLQTSYLKNYNEFFFLSDFFLSKQPITSQKLDFLFDSKIFNLLETNFNFNNFFLALFKTENIKQNFFVADTVDQNLKNFEFEFFLDQIFFLKNFQFFKYFATKADYFYWETKYLTFLHFIKQKNFNNINRLDLRQLLEIYNEKKIFGNIHDIQEIFFFFNSLFLFKKLYLYFFFHEKKNRVQSGLFLQETLFLVYLKFFLTHDVYLSQKQYILNTKILYDYSVINFFNKKNFILESTLLNALKTEEVCFFEYKFGKTNSINFSFFYENLYNDLQDNFYNKIFFFDTLTKKYFKKDFPFVISNFRQAFSKNNSLFFNILFEREYKFQNNIKKKYQYSDLETNFKNQVDLEGLYVHRHSIPSKMLYSRLKYKFLKSIFSQIPLNNIKGEKTVTYEDEYDTSYIEIDDQELFNDDPYQSIYHRMMNNYFFNSSRFGYNIFDGFGTWSFFNKNIFEDVSNNYHFSYTLEKDDVMEAEEDFTDTTIMDRLMFELDFEAPNYDYHPFDYETTDVYGNLDDYEEDLLESGVLVEMLPQIVLLILIIFEAFFFILYEYYFFSTFLLDLIVLEAPWNPFFYYYVDVYSFMRDLDWYGDIFKYIQVRGILDNIFYIPYLAEVFFLINAFIVFLVNTFNQLEEWREADIPLLTQPIELMPIYLYLNIYPNMFDYMRFFYPQMITLSYILEAYVELLFESMYDTHQRVKRWEKFIMIKSIKLYTIPLSVGTWKVLLLDYLQNKKTMFSQYLESLLKYFLVLFFLCITKISETKYITYNFSQIFTQPSFDNTVSNNKTINILLLLKNILISYAYIYHQYFNNIIYQKFCIFSVITCIFHYILVLLYMLNYIILLFNLFEKTPIILIDFCTLKQILLLFIYFIKDIQQVLFYFIEINISLEKISYSKKNYIYSIFTTSLFLLLRYNFSFFQLYYFYYYQIFYLFTQTLIFGKILFVINYFLYECFILINYCKDIFSLQYFNVPTYIIYWNKNFINLLSDPFFYKTDKLIKSFFFDSIFTYCKKEYFQIYFVLFYKAYLYLLTFFSEFYFSAVEVHFKINKIINILKKIYNSLFNINGISNIISSYIYMFDKSNGNTINCILLMVDYIYISINYFMFSFLKIVLLLDYFVYTFKVAFSIHLNCDFFITQKYIFNCMFDQNLLEFTLLKNQNNFRQWYALVQNKLFLETSTDYYITFF